MSPHPHPHPHHPPPLCPRVHADRPAHTHRLASDGCNPFFESLPALGRESDTFVPSPSVPICALPRPAPPPHVPPARPLPSAPKNTQPHPPQCLEQWLDDTLKVVADNRDLIGDGAVQAQQQVLLTCLHEIGRQVWVHCEERGRLLMRVQEYVTATTLPDGALFTARVSPTLSWVEGGSSAYCVDACPPQALTLTTVGNRQAVRAVTCAAAADC
jgi:hypothetical protein